MEDEKLTSLLTKLDTRLENIEQSLKENNQQINGIEQSLKETNKRIDHMEQAINNNIINISMEIIDKVYDLLIKEINDNKDKIEFNERMLAKLHIDLIQIKDKLKK